jgi:hypothetical protein
MAANQSTKRLAAIGSHAKSPPGTSYATVPAVRFFPDIDATAADLEKRFGHGFEGISVEDYRNSVALLGKDSASASHVLQRNVLS